jgi:simple sugar transport system ATP-binding protein
VVVARELDQDPQVLLASQPTRGVDIGSAEYIHRALLRLRDAGRAILLVSADLDEVLDLSDRIIVMYEGEIVGELPGSTATEEEVGLLMFGTRRQGGEGR